MAEIIKDVVLALGGAVGIVLILLAFGRSIIEKTVGNAVEHITAKGLAKYENALERSTLTYSILLKKEFAYYEDASIFTSKLVVDAQDITYNLNMALQEQEHSYLETVKALLLSILKEVPEYKNKLLLNQCYISANIFGLSAALINTIQTDSAEIYKLLEAAYSNTLTDKDIEKSQAITNSWLANAAALMGAIKEHLEKSSEQT